MKLNKASFNIIKYVAKEIRSRINKNPISITVASDSNDEISRNFWGYAKRVFRSGTAVLWSFDTVQGPTYFTYSLKCVNYMKVFTIPSWISKLKEPNIPFNLSLPSYQENTQIIKHIKSSSSPCPYIDNLFQMMSVLKIIYIKYLHWNRSNRFPAHWTKAATILIHKKHDPIRA